MDASVAEQDAVGLVPPPNSLAAPWAVKPAPEAQRPALPQAAAKREAVKPEEKKPAGGVTGRAVQPAPVPLQVQSSATSPREAAPQAARPQAACPQSARPQSAKPVAPRPAVEPIVER